MKKVLLFVWRHGTLGVDDYDSVERALGAAEYISDYGSGSPHGIQEGDRWITPDDEEWRTFQEKKWEEERTRFVQQPRNTHILEAQAPDGQWAQYVGYPNLKDARASADVTPAPTRIRTVGPRSRVVWGNMKQEDH